MKILSTAKFPLKDFIGKGSYKERLELAKELNMQFNEIVQTKMQNGEISTENYAILLKNFLPKIKIKFTPFLKALLNNKNPYVSTWNDYSDNVKGLEISIPYRKNDFNKQVISNKDIFLTTHETFHLFASLANPKHTARVSLSNKEYDFYKSNIYTRFHKNFKLKERMEWAKRLKNFVKSKDQESAINFLQNCRYRLIEENMAYQEGAKYSGKKSDWIKEFHFEEKIKIIEKLLYRTIRTGRKENKKRGLYESR